MGAPSSADCSKGLSSAERARARRQSNVQCSIPRSDQISKMASATASDQTRPNLGRLLVELVPETIPAVSPNLQHDISFYYRPNKNLLQREGDIQTLFDPSGDWSGLTTVDFLPQVPRSVGEMRRGDLMWALAVVREIVMNLRSEVRGNSMRLCDDIINAAQQLKDLISDGRSVSPDELEVVLGMGKTPPRRKDHRKAYTVSKRYTSTRRARANWLNRKLVLNSAQSA